jgi:hypothetical protein
VKKFSPPPGFDPLTVQPVANRSTVYATRPTNSVWLSTISYPCHYYWKSGKIPGIRRGYVITGSFPLLKGIVATDGASLLSNFSSSRKEGGNTHDRERLAWSLNWAPLARQHSGWEIKVKIWIVVTRASKLCTANTCTSHNQGSGSLWPLSFSDSHIHSLTHNSLISHFIATVSVRILPWSDAGVLLTCDTNAWIYNLNFTFTIPKCLKYNIKGKGHNSQTQQYVYSILIYNSIMGYMFRLLLESSSGHQDIDADIQNAWTGRPPIGVMIPEAV